MIWNETNNRYILTKEYFKNEFDSNYTDDAVLERRLKENSRLIYSFIRSRVNSYNRRVVDFVLNSTEEGKEFIKELLTLQIQADNETGFNDLVLTPQINVSNGQISDRNEFFKNQVCVAVEQEFDNSDAYFGFRIGYQAPFPAIYFTLLR